MHAEKRGCLVKFITCVTSGGRDLAWHAYRHRTFTGRSATERQLETPCIDMLAQARNVSIPVTFRMLEWCACSAKSLLPDVTHVMNFTRLPCFSACIIEKLEEPGYEAITYHDARWPTLTQGHPWQGQRQKFCSGVYDVSKF